MSVLYYRRELAALTVLAAVLVACSTTAAPAEDAPTAAPATATAAPTAAVAEEMLMSDQTPPTGAEREFRTDFSRAIISYAEVLSGGPPKDGIPAIDNPQFVNVESADVWLEDVEPVIRVQVGETARAYPIQVLMWHEIVNDTLGNLPLAVTFCPLCNTAIIFERTVDGQVLDFGTTGRLRFSNLIMYDRQTETWWQQATGEALAGELVSQQLAFYPGEIIAWADFRTTHPDGDVLSRDTGFSRAYGNNPYVGYDDVSNSPFAYRGPTIGGELPPIARVLAVEMGDEVVAYPYTTLEEAGVVNDTVGGTDLVVFWSPGTASALDTPVIAEGRDVGAANAYRRTFEGQPLTFTVAADGFVDEQTGSTWNGLGQAVAGELAGATLEPVVAVNHFWFSWSVFKPETQIYQPS
ncbi:MAG: DUF3179 domain-containing protein [Chloroflexaceae bacterium]|nr:DUF3179 domain-containing protein [Chloroflexaceae bacterium]NJO07580.1 DUF3179 domain-containing protein [Chloroflexaceae bacterium]